MNIDLGGPTLPFHNSIPGTDSCILPIVSLHMHDSIHYNEGRVTVQLLSTDQYTVCMLLTVLM